MSLGFDACDSDFKVLRYGNRADMKQVAKMYNLNTDSWREISSQLPLKHHYYSCKSVFCGTAYYWNFYGLKKNIHSMFQYNR